jgi:hypothetical protein
MRYATTREYLASAAFDVIFRYQRTVRIGRNYLLGTSGHGLFGQERGPLAVQITFEIRS